MRPALWAAFPWVCGIWLGLSYDVPLGAVSAALGISVAVAAVLWRQELHRAALVALLITVGALGGLRASLWKTRQPDAARLASLLNAAVQVVGTVSTDPNISGRIWQFGVEADTVRSDSLMAIGRIPVFVRLDTALGAVRIGERVRLVGTLRPLPRPRAPDLFDYRAYLSRRGYAATLSVYTEAALSVFAGPRGASVRFWDAARSYVRATITRGLPPDEAGLVRGLVLGDRSGLSRRVLDEFQTCGVVHILAVSGLHVGIVLAGVGWPLVRVFGRKWWQLPVLVLSAWAYAALTGGNPPVVRASIMATVFLASVLVRRAPDAWNALAASALITLLVSPQVLFEIGFQLSYVAVAGILLVAGPLAAYFGRVRFSKWNPAGKFVTGLIVMTIAAQATIWPLVAHYFYRVPLLGALSNPPVVALVTFAVWGAMLSLIVGWWPVAAQLVNAPVSWLLRGVLWTAERFASWPGAALWVRPPGWIEIAACAALLWTAWHLYRRRGLLTASLGALLLFANLWVWSGYFHCRTGLEVTFLDVGQGDAIVVAAPNGETVLIDGGAASPWFDAGNWTVVPYLRSQGVRRVDVVVATHLDNDHIGGLASVLARMEVGQVWYNGRKDTTEVFRNFMGTARERGVTVRSVAAGDSVLGLGDVRMLVLGPPRDSLAIVWWSDNDLSVVLRLDAYGKSVLLTGDAAFMAEDRLVRTWDGRLRSDVLKVAHHGSAHSTSDAFLAAVEPQWGVVSVGDPNRYGHPAPPLLERLDRRGVAVLRIDRCGTLTWHVEPDTSWWQVTTSPD